MTASSLSYGRKFLMKSDEACDRDADEGAGISAQEIPGAVATSSKYRNRTKDHASCIRNIMVEDSALDEIGSTGSSFQRPRRYRTVEVTTCDHDDSAALNRNGSNYAKRSSTYSGTFHDLDRYLEDSVSVPYRNAYDKSLRDRELYVSPPGSDPEDPWEDWYSPSITMENLVNGTKSSSDLATYGSLPGTTVQSFSVNSGVRSTVATSLVVLGGRIRCYYADHCGCCCGTAATEPEAQKMHDSFVSYDIESRFSVHLGEGRERRRGLGLVGLCRGAASSLARAAATIRSHFI